MKHKMTEAFKNANGGLFESVEKADVGSAYQQLEKNGVALMGWADPFMPDFCLPEHIRLATIEAINAASASHYTAPIGNALLKKRLAQKLLEINHLSVDPERNILITPGSDAGLYYAMLPFINPLDEILIPCPSYPNNFHNTEIMSAIPVLIPLYEENGYQIDIQEFEARVTSKTKMVVLTHPNNPTTTVFNAKSLQTLASFVIKHDLILVCDQAFEDFCFENEMITPAALPGMFDRTMTVFSVSKGMGLSGYRVGYIVCSDVIMDTLYANAVSVIGATNTVSQWSILAAFEDLNYMKIFEEAYEYRRNQAYEILNSIPNVSMLKPESGFLCWVNVSKLGTASKIVNYLVKEAKVSVNDGINYGLGGDGHVRIVLGVFKDNQKVVDALIRIKNALMNYKE